MRWVAALLATILLPCVAQAHGYPSLDVKASESLRVMVSDGQYASRVENNLQLDVGPVFVVDVFDFNRTGVVQVSPTRAVPRNFGNNEFTLGVRAWHGVGAAYQRTDWLSGRSINRAGLAYRGTWRSTPATISYTATFLGTDDEYWFRQHSVITLKIPRLHAFVTERFIWDQGPAYQLNSKLTAGFEVTKNVAVVVQRQDITGKPPDNRAGVQLKVALGE